MNHELPTFNPFETEHPNNPVFRGFMDTVHEPKMELPLVMHDGQEVRTNLPPELLSQIFEPADHESMKHPFYGTLLPSAVDNIPVGRYYIKDPQGDSSAFFDREITVTEDEDGKHTNYMRTGLLQNRGKSKDLLSALGVKFGFNGIESTPTPETLKKKAAKLGVDIKFFPEQGKLDSKTYLSAFADGQYPVATGNSEFYAHDTADDHLTTMVLGGEPLRIALQRVAKEALEAGDKAEIDKRTGRIDEFTAYLRGTVSPTHNMMAYDYGEPIVQFVGKQLGLSPEEVSRILETCRANAAKFGMELNPVQ